jgi:hypothetical protein
LCIIVHENFLFGGERNNFSLLVHGRIPGFETRKAGLRPVALLT